MSAVMFLNCDEGETGTREVIKDFTSIIKGSFAARSCEEAEGGRSNPRHPMPDQFELTVLPLHRRDGQDQSTLPGLLATEKPRRAARGRGGDRLVLQLTVAEDSGLSPEQQRSLLQDMASGYFRTPGAVTSALREQAERLNAYLLQRNQMQKGALAPALLSIVTLGERRVTLAQCGPVQAFLLGDDIQHYFDPQTAGRGLGLSQTTDIRFYQFDLTEGDFLLLLPELPGGWDETTFQGVRGQKLETLRRRFLGEAGADLQAVLLAARPGEGLRLISGQELATSAPVANRASRLSPTAAGAPRNWEAVEVPTAEAETGEPPASEQAASTAGWESTTSEASDALGETGPIPVSSRPTVLSESWERISARAGQITNRFLPPLRTLLLRLLPEEPIFNLPPRTMGLIALLVPLAVVVLVSVVYLQFGREQLYATYLERAQSAAAVAAAAQEPEAIREAWKIAVFYAQRAVNYEADDRTAAALLAGAQKGLDDLDFIKRVQFAQALLTPLPNDAKITRLAASSTGDVYLLNETDGSILHAFATGNAGPGGYQLDEDFHCEPGQYGEFIVSKLVDLALLPRDAPNDWVLAAVDNNGNIIYCAKNARPTHQVLEPPDSLWGSPSAITIEFGNLYMLDPLTNAVWIFEGEDYSFAGAEPHFFFGAEVPNLKQMLDLDVQADTLFLIHQDGHTAICEFSDDVDNPTACNDPATYGDSRPGRRDAAILADAHFSQIQLTQAPLESLFMLDPVARAVYQFNLNLQLQRQFRAVTELPEGIITAFAISPQQSIFLALEDQLFFGYIPAE